MSEILNISAGKSPSLPLAPKVVDVKPFGSMVLVEHLTKQELTSAIVQLAGQKDEPLSGTNQAYIVAIGPNLSEDCGLKVGDRVLLQGTFNPVPSPDGAIRPRGVIEVHMIKAILIEEGKTCSSETCCQKKSPLIGDFPELSSDTQLA